MKAYFFIAWFLTANCTTIAQVAIPDQPDSNYYTTVVNTCKIFTPTEYDIVNVKPNTIPATITDTLKKYDWYVIGTFGYTEANLRLPFRKDKDQFDNNNYQFDFRRFCKDGVIGDFYLQKTTSGKATLFTNTFDKNTAQKFAGIKKAGSKTYLHTIFYEESEYEQIVFYKNRILVIDITMLGKIGEKKVKYRKMYYGMPQLFKW